MKKTITLLALLLFFKVNAQVCTTSVSANPICLNESVTISVVSPTFNCSTALPSALQASLAAYYPFCGNANDVSGNANNGAVIGASLTTDRFGNANSAYSFNGTSDEIQVPHSASLTYSNNTISVAFWMKVPTWPTGGLEHYLFSKHSGVGATQMGYHFYIQGLPSHEIDYRYKNGGASSWGSSLAITNTLVTDGSWFHVVVTTDNTVDKMYVNGAITYTATSQVMGANTNTLYFGHDPVGGQFYGGVLDDIAIYNKALNQTEVSQLYNLGNTTYSWSTGSLLSSISVTPSATTNYSVTSSNGFTSCNSVVTITVSSCTDIKELSNSNNISFSPNPNNGDFYINTDTDIILTITNELGQIIKTIDTSKEKNNQISITNLPNGIYFISGNNNTTSVKQKILVVN